jgi:hypothetical protein
VDDRQYRRDLKSMDLERRGYRKVRKGVKKRRGLEHIIGALAAGGYLIIGAHKILPSRPRVLQPCDGPPWAFRKGNPD